MALRRATAVLAAALALTAPSAGAEDVPGGAPAPAMPAGPAGGLAASVPAHATLAEPSRNWHLYGGFGYGAAEGEYGEFLEEPVQFELRIAKQSASGAWRFGAGLQFGSMEMKPSAIPPGAGEQKEWAHLETFGTVTRVFSPGRRLRPYLQARVGLVRIHPRSELFYN